jgi:hypothetical protein
MRSHAVTAGKHTYLYLEMHNAVLSAVGRGKSLNALYHGARKSVASLAIVPASLPRRLEFAVADYRGKSGAWVCVPSRLIHTDWRQHPSCCWLARGGRMTNSEQATMTSKEIKRLVWRVPCLVLQPCGQTGHASIHRASGSSLPALTAFRCARNCPGSGSLLGRVTGRGRSWARPGGS